jgi:hypothetical protein
MAKKVLGLPSINVGSSELPRISPQFVWVKCDLVEQAVSSLASGWAFSGKRVPPVSTMEKEPTGSPTESVTYSRNPTARSSGSLVAIPNRRIEEQLYTDSPFSSTMDRVPS